MIVERLAVTCNLSETSLETAALALGGVRLHELTVTCGYWNRVVAQKLQGRFGFDLVLVPDCMLKTPYAWGVEHPRGVVWTEGE